MLDNKAREEIGKRGKALREKTYGRFPENLQAIFAESTWHHDLDAFEVLALCTMWQEVKEENEELREELLTVQAYLLE
jgi:hypothetical protein